MKIDRQKSDRVEKTDDTKRKDRPSKEGDEKDFKKLLERKSGKKGDETGKKSKKRPKKAPKDAAGARSDKMARSDKTNKSDKMVGSDKMAGSDKNSQPLTKKSPNRLTSTFGERLKDGKLQLGQQTEQTERLGTERHTKRHHSETRLEHRHRKKHHRQVHNDHAKNQANKPLARPDSAIKRPREAPKGVLGKPGPVAPDSVEGTSQASPIAGAEPASASKADAAAPGDRAQRRAEAAELARKIVDKTHIGQDASGRQIKLLDLDVPGRGNVRVRLRRRGEGFELRMRPENDDLARDLRHEREHFRQSAAEGGVDFTSIEIV